MKEDEELEKFIAEFKELLLRYEAKINRSIIGSGITLIGISILCSFINDKQDVKALTGHLIDYGYKEVKESINLHNFLHKFMNK